MNKDGFSSVVKEEINLRKIRRSNVPEEVKETLKEIFEYNDSVSSNSDRISIEWTSKKLKEQGYLISKHKLITIAVEMGRKSWALK